jgi:Zn finger protein HypA/HybF involved in hydrogenase expression
MKCESCNYEKENNNDPDFIWMKTSFMVEGIFTSMVDKQIKLYACPKCGTLKINIQKGD